MPVEFLNRFLEGADAEVDDEGVDGEVEGEAYFAEAFAPFA
jgi:hypothetical protein